ncbi:ATP-dependent helicase [Alicyclobacillus ferrooxydans]|uniref:DNA 3'-5' helicase n=1 Tax=Alicyclobacillus ferrooxydans TaxID=471514 RepID=A0A0P9D8J9_9BACL|nr:ATP-dependent helicase [Alicyclobacillus ferrooxydans]KPV45662.1 DNA helicase UvrD [Alicyclobacillus ferrooxydans]
MGTWIRATVGRRNFKLAYADLIQGDAATQELLHELYEARAEVACMCDDKPIPMHIRRIRIRPPTYCLVTNKHHQHAESCFRGNRPLTTSKSIPSTLRDDAPEVPNKQIQMISATSITADDYSDHTFNPDISRDERRTFVPNVVELNAGQREAAIHKDGPCIVVAAAGSGKTAMLIARMSLLVENSVKPERILACTFTRKAADEMKDRLVAVLGSRGNQITIGTIHSIAYRMVMPQLGQGWSVVTEPSWLIEQVLESPGGSHNRHGVGKILAQNEATLGVCRAKANALWPMQVDGALGKVYKAYENLKLEKKKLDFEDLLLHAVRLFQTRPDLAQQWQNRFDYVLVDEFQDVNQIQWLFLCELVKKTRNLCVVGDDWQSIYGFRGARPALMQSFLRQFPNAKKVVLSMNYRSHDLIVDLGNRVIELNQGHQIEKRVQANRGISESAVVQIVTVQSDVEEARFVANEIQQMKERWPEVPYNEYAVLYRTNIQSRVYEEALAERGIAYQIVGDSHFYESRDVKVILDYLRMVCDKSDPTLWGPLINRPKRFVPNAVVRDVQQGGWEAVKNHEKCQAFIRTITELEKHLSPADAIRWLVEAEPGLVRSQDDLEPIKWVDSLIHSATRYETIPEFLRFVDWVIEWSQSPKRDAVQLMSIHRSKGLEFETVFVTGLVEGLLPHKKSLTEEGVREETRLCYVAITRARENLYLLSSETYGDTAFEMSRYIKALQG